MRRSKIFPAYVGSGSKPEFTAPQHRCALCPNDPTLVVQQIGLYSSPHRSTRLYRELVAIGCIALFTT